MVCQPPLSSLFPYTTLFRSLSALRAGCVVSRSGEMAHDRRGMPDSIRGRFHHFVDRKSTRLNSSHITISYAAFCLKKNNRPTTEPQSKLNNHAAKIDMHDFG